MRHRPVTPLEVAVLIPRVGAVAGADALVQAAQLDEAHTALHQAPRQQTLQPVAGDLPVGGVHAVHFFRGLSLALKAAQLRHGRLHAKRGLVVAHRRLDVVVATDVLDEFLIQSLDEIEPGTLRLPRLTGTDIAHRRRAIPNDDGALVFRRQIAVAEQSHAPVRNGCPARLQHHEAGHVLVFCPQSIRHPRPCGRVAHERKPRVERVVALRVFVDLTGHGANHRQLVRHRR